MMHNTKILPDADQRKAALDPTQSFIVQAPAGSGKTSLLIQRYLTLLAGVKNPEEIVAITFTRKAAQEMRLRVVEALAEATTDGVQTADYGKQTQALAQAALAQDKVMDWQIIDHPYRLSIMTIDAFCADLVRQMPLLSKMLTPSTISEDIERDYLDAATTLIQSIDEDCPTSKALQALLAHLDNDLSKLQRLFVQMLAQRDQWLPYVAADHDDLSVLRKQLEQSLANLLTDKLTDCRHQFPAEQVGLLLEVMDFATLHMDESNPLKPLFSTCEQLDGLPTTEPSAHQPWQAIADFLLTQKGTWRKSITQKLGFPAPSHGSNAEEKAYLKAMKAAMKELLAALQLCPTLAQTLAQVRDCPKPVYDDHQWSILCALLTVLPVLVAHLSVILGERNRTDFCQITLAAQQALGAHDDPSDLALSMDYAISHLLLDEFQDTSSTQYHLLEKLIAGWQPDDGRTLLLVGDPMQSIYRFRQAEVNLFLRTRANGIAAIKPISLQLSTNFRSTEPLIDCLNQTCQGMFPAQDDIDDSAIAFSPADAPPKAAYSSLDQHELPMAVQLFAHQVDENQAIIEIINRTRQNNPEASIAILVRSRTHLTTLLPALKKADIAYQGVDIEYLGSRSVIRDLFALTQALFDPMDRTAWLAILRAPWCGLTLADLYQIAEQTPSTSPVFKTLSAPPLALSDEGKQRLARIVPILGIVLAERARASTSQWIQGCWHALGAPACFSEARDFEDAQAYFALLLKLEQTKALLCLDTLTQNLAQLYAQPISTELPVQIMTIHRAKGLEFDTVILPRLDARARNNSQPLLLWEERHRPDSHDLLLTPIAAQTNAKATDPIYHYMWQKNRKKDHYETTRLLYVAMTRARQKLHLLATMQAKAENKTKPIYGSLLSHLWDTIYSKEVQIKPLKETPGTSPDTPPDSPPEKRLIRRLKAHWKNPLHPNLPTYRPSRQSALPAYVASSLAQETGILIHACLQKLSLIKNPAFQQHWQPLAQYSTHYLRGIGLPSTQINKSLAIIAHAIKNTLQDKRGQWILHPHQDAHSEYAITSLEKNSPKRYSIDRTFIDEHGTRWIIDYKTSAMARGESTADFLSEQIKQHQAQLVRYTEIMGILDGHSRPIKAALYFPMGGLWCETSAL